MKRIQRGNWTLFADDGATEPTEDFLVQIKDHVAMNFWGTIKIEFSPEVSEDEMVETMIDIETRLKDNLA
jgi:hypothetical protein